MIYIYLQIINKKINHPGNLIFALHILFYVIFIIDKGFIENYNITVPSMIQC